MVSEDNSIDINYSCGKEWSREFEEILIVKADKSKCMGKLCSYTSTYYGRQRTYLLVPASVLAWCLNIFGMFATYYGSTKIPDPLVILITSIGNFIIASFTTIAEKSQAGDKVELFNQTSREYILIASEISQQLMYEPANRIPPMQLINDMARKYNDLMRSTPNIPQNIVDDFRRHNEQNRDYLRMHKPEQMVEMTSTAEYVYRKPELFNYDDNNIALKQNIPIYNTNINDNDNDNDIDIDINNENI